jgi:hypothetical protein
MRDAVRLDPQFFVTSDGLADSLRTLASLISETRPEQGELLRVGAWER